MIPSDASVAHLGLLLSQIPDRALGRLYCFGSCPCFGSAVRMQAPGQTRRKSWQGATRLSTGLHRREQVKGCLARSRAEVAGCQMGVAGRGACRDSDPAFICHNPHKSAVYSHKLRGPQMICSVTASSPRYKYSLRRYNKPTRQNPVPAEPDYPTQTMRHRHTPLPALCILSTRTVERVESVVPVGLNWHLR